MQELLKRANLQIKKAEYQINKLFDNGNFHKILDSNSLTNVKLYQDVP